MGTVYIRKVEDDLKARLRVRAAEHGRSMEEEARAILRDALNAQPKLNQLAESIRSKFAPFGGVELELPPRELLRDPPDFQE